MRLPGCLLARLLKNACMDLDETVRVDRCRDMDKLIIARIPEPDCFLQYCMRCKAEFYYVGKTPSTGIGRPPLQRRMVLKWFYSPRAVGTPLSAVHALLRVHMHSCECTCTLASALLVEEINEI